MVGRIHVPLFLVALVIAVAIKVAVHEGEAAGERFLEVPVTYNPPSNGVTFYDQVGTVRVRLRGTTTGLAQVTALNVEVIANIPKDQFGTVSLNLEESDVRVRTPGNFDVLSIEPNQITLQVERRIQRTVPVVARLEGEPAAGARAGTTVVRPGQVEITGPESRVLAIERLSAPVSLDGHALTFEETVVVTSPDPLVRVLSPNRVVVHIPMDEPQLSNYEGLIEENGTR